MVDRKDVKQVAVGAGLGVLLDIATQLPFEYDPAKWSGTWPYVTPVEGLPPVDDWIVAGVPIAAYLLARQTKAKQKTQNITLGAALYGGAMFLHHTWIRVTQALQTREILKAQATYPSGPKHGTPRENRIGAIKTSGNAVMI